MRPLVVLTSDRIKRGFFMRKCMAVFAGPKKSGRNKEVTVRRGSTVICNSYLKGAVTSRLTSRPL